MGVDAVARVAELQSMLATLVPPVGATAPVAATAAPASSASSFAGQLAEATSPSATTNPSGAAPFAAEIDAAAARHGIDPALLRGLVQQESGFNPAARSGAGAVGLTQLMPATAQALGVTDPTDPAQALEGGAAYLREQLDHFGGDEAKALAAYNAGPGAVQRYGGVPPFAETQRYVQNVLSLAASYRTGVTA